MADATSAAPLPMMRRTTSRTPRNAATISEVDMACLPLERGLRRRRDYDRGANPLSAILIQGEDARGFPFRRLACRSRSIASLALSPAGLTPAQQMAL